MLKTSINFINRFINKRKAESSDSTNLPKTSITTTAIILKIYFTLTILLPKSIGIKIAVFPSSKTTPHPIVGFFGKCFP